MDDEYEDSYEFEDSEEQVQDINGVCNALKAAWKLLPTHPLANLLDVVLPSSVSEMSDDEIIEALDEFIHQNQ